MEFFFAHSTRVSGFAKWVFLHQILAMAGGHGGSVWRRVGSLGPGLETLARRHRWDGAVLCWISVVKVRGGAGVIGCCDCPGCIIPEECVGVKYGCVPGPRFGARLMVVPMFWRIASPGGSDVTPSPRFDVSVMVTPMFWGTLSPRPSAMGGSSLLHRTSSLGPVALLVRRRPPPL